MKGNGWRITVGNDVVGGGKFACNIIEYPIRFRLKDDDGYIYFWGRMTQKLYHSGEDIFAPLDDFGLHYGCTSMEILENGKWGVI